MKSTDYMRYARALTSSAILLAIAIGLALTTRFVTLTPGVLDTVELAARILLVLAIGLAIFRVGLAILDARMAGIDISVKDNLVARRRTTRLNMVRRLWMICVGVMVVAAALTAIPWARQIGISMFASAGIIGLAVGIAAQPVLANLIAGLQIAFTQPIRIDDVVIVEGEWGQVEEIGLFHVVIRIWDLRRLVVPLGVFIEQPFQNWTRESASIIGAVTWNLDYRAPVEAMRAKLDEIVKPSQLWDGEVCGLQVTEAEASTIQVRAIVSTRNAGDAWDLRCLIREAMITWLNETHPEALPRIRAEAELNSPAPNDAPAGR